MRRVHGRHQHVQPLLESYALNVLAAADDFMDAHDRLRTLTTTRGRELEGKLSAAVVVDELASWLVQVAAIVDPSPKGNCHAMPERRA